MAQKCPKDNTWLNRINVSEQNYEMHNLPKEWIGKILIFCSNTPQHGWLIK